MKIRKGFTLVELLVVISIIALLLSILMPSLGKVREMGKSLVCQTHMKGLVLSWTLYAVNNDDRLCGAFNYNNNYANWGHPWDWTWAPWRADVDMGVPYGGPYLEEQREEGIKRGAMYEYSKNVGIYHCPSDKSGNLRSYSIPDCLSGREAERHPDDPAWKVITRLSRIKKTSTKYVFLEENDPRGYNMDSWAKNPSGTSWSDPLTVWHSGASNIAFADGHSENKKWSKETTDHFMNYEIGDPPLRPTTSKGLEDLKYMLRGWAE